MKITNGQKAQMQAVAQEWATLLSLEESLKYTLEQQRKATDAKQEELRALIAPLLNADPSKVEFIATPCKESPCGIHVFVMSERHDAVLCKFCGQSALKVLPKSVAQLAAEYEKSQAENG